MMEYTETCLYLAVDGEQLQWKYGPLPWDMFLVTQEYLNDTFYPVAWLDHRPVTTTQVFWDEAYTLLQEGVIEPHYMADEDGGVYEVDALGQRTLLCMTSTWGRPDDIAYALNQVFPQTDTKAFHQQQRKAAEQRMQSVINALRPLIEAESYVHSE